MGLDHCRELIGTYYRISLDELLREQCATDRVGCDHVPNDRLRLSMGRWQQIGQRRLLAAHSLSQLAQRGPLSRSCKSNKFASQIRQVQFSRFRVIWRV